MMGQAWPKPGMGVCQRIFEPVSVFQLTGAVAPIAAVNNYLLPAFMIILGVALVRWPAGVDSADA